MVEALESVMDKWCRLLFMGDLPDQLRELSVLWSNDYLVVTSLRDESKLQERVDLIYSNQSAVGKWTFHCVWSDWFRRVCLLWTYLEEEQTDAQLLDFLKIKLDVVKKVHQCLLKHRGFPHFNLHQPQPIDAIPVDIEQERDDWLLMDKSAYLPADWLLPEIKLHVDRK